MMIFTNLIRIPVILPKYINTLLCFCKHGDGTKKNQKHTAICSLPKKQNTLNSRIYHRCLLKQSKSKHTIAKHNET